MSETIRCPWAMTPLAIDYHDAEWGMFTLDDRVHFEHLSLEGFQAGLSWETILKKRGHLRRLFAGFDPEAIATFDEVKIAEILADPGGIRNAAKIKSTVNNAHKFLEVRREFETFSEFFLNLMGGKPIVNNFASLSEIPAETELSKRVSAELKRRGFTFVGPTTIYAHLQAVGFINDHLVECFRRKETADRMKHYIDGR